MKKNLAIQLKAVFLLIVFGLNTMVGFACSMGLEIGFNVHSEEVPTSHHHDEKNDTQKDGCCTDAVIKFLEIDKSFSQPLTAAIDSVDFTAIAFSFYHSILSGAFKTVPNNKYALQNYHPPGVAIRIAIQSFQI